MKKYTLFSEFSEKEIYGEDLGDALMHCGPLHFPGMMNENNYVPGEKLMISKVLCYEKTDGSTRGKAPFQRAIVELDDGTRLSIDAKPASDDTLIL